MRVIGVVGASGSGKTTLIEALIPYLRRKGLRIGYIKHAHHGFQLDQPGKDSWRCAQAGAQRILLVAPGAWALMQHASEPDEAKELDFAHQLEWMAACDLVLVEGFKKMPIPKVEVFRPQLGKAPLWPAEPSVVLVAAPQGQRGLEQAGFSCDRPVVALEQRQQLAELFWSLATPGEKVW